MESLLALLEVGDLTCTGLAWCLNSTGEAEFVVIMDDLNSSCLGKIVIGLVFWLFDQFISFRASLKSSSSDAVGSITSITDAVPFPDSKPLFELGEILE